MKTQIKIFIAIVLLAASCKKENNNDETTTQSTPDNYSSMTDFYAKNGVSLQSHSIDASTGGSFITPQGTTVNIPANAFTTFGGGNVTGNVTIEFKDIYKKSDMLLSDKQTLANVGELLKSGGEFFIKAVQNGEPLLLAATKKIDVLQPAEDGIANDSAMAPFVAALDSTGSGFFSWQPSWFDTLNATASEYVFSLYSFQSPEDSGTWCNSDNQIYFSAFSGGNLTVHTEDNPDTFQTEVFLVFSSVNCMVHVYRNWQSQDFTYQYAPQGLSCTIVSVGVKSGKLYSSFNPLTIGSMQTIHVTLSETTTADFKSALNALN